jgi:hypothetical protein
MSPEEEIRMRAATVKLLADISGAPIIPALDDAEEATMLAKAMISDPKLRPDFAVYKNETMAYLAGMVAKLNFQVVDDLAELKIYICNKLLIEAEQAPDSKTRIMALRNLGEISGVDAFMKRTEMTIKVKPIDEVERELLTILENVEYKLIEGGNGQAGKESVLVQDKIQPSSESTG